MAPKIIYCLPINSNGVKDEYKTFKGFKKVSDNLDRREYSKAFVGDTLVAKVPFSWKRSFSMGVVIPQKMGNCNECAKDILCDWCDKLVNQRKKFSANLNEKNHLLMYMSICFLGIKQFECDIFIIQEMYLKLVKKNLHCLYLMINDVMRVILKVKLGEERHNCMIMYKNSNFQGKLRRNKKTHRRRNTKRKISFKYISRYADLFSSGDFFSLVFKVDIIGSGFFQSPVYGYCIMRHS